MANWIIWAIAAGVVVILELFSGTFYLLMVAVGIAAGAVAAWLGWSEAVQFLVAATVGVVATIALNRGKFGLRGVRFGQTDDTSNLDIGQSIEVAQWTVHENGSASARAVYRGAQWDIDFEGSAPPQPGTFQIVAMRGSRLLVTHSARATG